MTEPQKYIRDLKKKLNDRLAHSYSVAQVHLVNDVIVVDIRVKYRNLLHKQRFDLIYHDCYALPQEIGYGIASVQASMIADTFNTFLNGNLMID